jgi:hypothetical protein
MNTFRVTKELIQILSPLIVLQICLAAYCGTKIFKEGVQNLNKWAWLIICVFVSVFGPIAFLLAGRKKEFN